MANRFLRLLDRLRRNQRANVLMIFGFTVLPLTFATGMGIDYARAMKAQTKLNAVADAAALTAVSKTVMPLPDASATSYALQMFQIQSQAVLASSGIKLTGLTATSPTDKNGRRTATVSYTALSSNLFARILGMATLPIHGTSQTTNATAPDIDFYMLLDVSSSMALPTTSAGLAQVAASNSRGCQFACHSSNDLKGKDATGKQNDLYGVAKSYGLTLRIDDEGTAVSKLTQDAQSTSSKNGASYQMAISTFRGAKGFATIQTLTPNMALAATKTASLAPTLYYSNGCPTSACKSTEVGYADQDTGTSDAFTQMASLIPTPGTGVNGQSPQSIMFIVTDGMRDETRPGGRPEIAIDTTKCDAIKNKGTRIAVLYTEYLPQSLNNDSWSQTNVAPYLYQVEPALQACASPGLYTKVSTDQDIYTALDALFQNAVATAKITG
jgi:Flp pilus assembly protein TadG